MKRLCYILVLVGVYTNVTSSQCVMLDSSYISNIVVINKMTDTGYVFHGTGFFVTLWGERRNCLILVTNRHVFGNYRELYIHVSMSDQYIKAQKQLKTTGFGVDGQYWSIENDRLVTKIMLRDHTGNELFTAYPEEDNIDVAVIPIPLSTEIVTLLNDGSRDTIKTMNLAILPQSSFGVKNDIKMGTNVLFLGFPKELGNINPIMPVMRAGAIAWTHRNIREFLIDAVSLEGNSGSPVFTNIPFSDDCKWIGIISGHLREEGLIYQPDPKTKSVLLTQREIENWNLASAIPIDLILPLLEISCDRYLKNNQQKK